MKKLTERPTDYDIDFEYDPEPLLIRIRNLAPRRRELFDQWYTANVRGAHKIRSLDWETVTAVSKALTAYESDAALGDGDNAHRADTELMMPLAARMAELEPGTRMLVLDLFANYGVQYEDPQALTTVGQVDCMMYLLNHLPASFTEPYDLFAGATDITDQSKGWDELAIERRLEEAAADNGKAVAKALENAPKGEDDNQRAPVDYEADVPEGKVSDITDWVLAPRNNTQMDAREAQQMVRERSHQAEIAEIRRRGSKQRKSLFEAMRKHRPSNWVPPYLRGTPASEASPAMPGAVDVAKLTEGQSIHITISHGGAVGYWVEG